MADPLHRVLYWTPRVFCILYAAFISIFALDVFGHEQGFWRTFGALLIHLLPAFLVLGVLALSWRREWIGAVVNLGLAALWTVWAWPRPFFGWVTFLGVAGPLLLTAVLFLLNWRWRIALRAAP